MLAAARVVCRGPAARLAARSMCTAVPMEEQMSVILKEKLSASKVEIEDTSGGALVVVRASSDACGEAGPFVWGGGGRVEVGERLGRSGVGG